MTSAPTPGTHPGSTPGTPPGTARVTRTFAVPAATAWDALTDARRHGRWVPMTRVATDGPARLGTRVVATSGPGAHRGVPGLVDRMQITRFDPPGDVGAGPGVAVFTKRGPLLLGEATVEVLATSPTTCRVTWSERVPLVGPLPAALTTRLTAPLLGGMLRIVLGRAAAELAA